MITGHSARLTTTSGVRGRDEFRLDPERRHLNHGSFGAVPSRTIDYRAGLAERLESNPLRWFDELADRHAAVRSAVAAFVGAPVNEIAMVSNASAAASALFVSIPLRNHDEVLITDHTYGAVAMGAKRYAHHWGASLRTACVPAAEADCEVGVSTWSGQGFIRISAHAYNEAADYEHFIDRGIPVIASVSAGAASA